MSGRVIPVYSVNIPAMILKAYPALWVLVRMIFLCQFEISFPDFTFLMSKDKNDSFSIPQSSYLKC